MADPSVCEPFKNTGMSSPKLEDFEVLNVIGAGSFGTCYRVRCKLDDNIYVWKAIDYGHMNDNKKLLLVSEVNLLSELKHPNIVRYYDRILHKETTTLFIIMECCQGGDLASVISTCKKNHTFVEESFIWQVLYQTARALQACHSHLGNVTVLHRDIKPANVFLDSDGNVKLGDFGLARILKNNEAYSETIVGTPYYMSPEVLKGGKYNRKSDIWALGCLIYELCALLPPFLASGIKQLVSNIKNGRFNRIPSHYSDDLHKMIEFMLSLDHEYRPTIEMILHHPTVVLHVSQRCISKFVPYKSRGSNEIIDKDINDGLKQMSFCEREPQAISEKTFKGKWLIRLEALREKEANLRTREENLLSKERSLIKKEKHLLLLEKLAKEKVLRAEVYLRQCKENKSVCSSATNRHSKIPTIEEIDTSFSADPGDTSILPTSTKIDPLSVPKPNQFFRSASERRRSRHVHFDVSSKQADNKNHLLLRNTSNTDFIYDHDKTAQVKENKPVVLCNHNKIENKNHNKIENKTLDRNIESYTEERAVWLENKRIIYHTAEKENNDLGENLELHSAHTGTIRKKINRSLSSVFTKKKVLNLR